MRTSIVVPFDFSNSALKAFEQACFIADVSGGNIHLLHVTNSAIELTYPLSWRYQPGFYFPVEKRMLNTAHKRKEKLLLRNMVTITVEVVHSKDISKAVLRKYTEHKADLIVMGTHGFSGIRKSLFGSNTSSLVGRGEAPVIAVPFNWKPKPLAELIIAAKSVDMKPKKAALSFWTKYFNAQAEIVEFLPKAKYESAEKSTTIHGVKVSIQPTSVNLNLAQNISQYTVKRKEALLIMFVHKRNMIQKVFNSSITGEVSGVINIPLLALPA